MVNVAGTLAGNGVLGGPAFIAGGLYNDLLVVNGDLTLDGILNVSTSVGGTGGSLAGDITNNATLVFNHRSAVSA